MSCHATQPTSEQPDGALCAFHSQAVLPTKRSADLVNRIGWLWVASNVFNSLWILAFIGGTPTSTVLSCPMLFGLLASIVAIAWRTGAWQAADAADRTWMDVTLVDIPFSIYYGWCTVAAIVNVSAAGVACGARLLKHTQTHTRARAWRTLCWLLPRI